jgi:hypothetical protein
LRPLNAGIATYRGTELPDATPEAPAIVDQDTFRTVKAILSDPSRRTTSGRPVSTLLSSVLRCGVCGGRMSSGTRVKRLASGERTVVQLYRCASRGPDGEGSRGHVTRPRAKLDPAVEQLMVAWLMRNAEQLRRPASELSGKLAEQAAQAEALHAKLGAFQAQAAEMDPVDYAAATRAIRAKLAALDQQRIRAIGRPATESVLRAADIPKAWAGMSVDDRRAVVVENISAITVGPGVPGRRDQTMHAVTVDWREL